MHLWSHARKTTASSPSMDADLHVHQHTLQTVLLCLSVGLLYPQEGILKEQCSLIAFLWRGEACVYFGKSLVLITRRMLGE